MPEIHFDELVLVLVLVAVVVDVEAVDHVAVADHDDGVHLGAAKADH